MLHRCLILLSFLWAVEVQGQIYGKIRLDNGSPAKGAHVYIHELNRVLSTDKNGIFYDEKVKKGHYHMHISFLGHKPYDLHFEVPLTDSIYVDLSQSEMELQRVVVEDYGTKSLVNDQSQSVSVVDAEDIRRAGLQTFSAALEKVPGVQALTTGVGIAKPAIRGLGFNRVAVTENGIKQEGQQWGGDHGLEIDAADVERVEIVKGPAAILYGSDALTGAVNIRPGPPPPINSYKASFSGGFISLNNLWKQSSAIQLNKKNVWLKMRFSSMDYADYKVPSDTFVYNGYVFPIQERKIKNTAGRERTVSATLGYSFNSGYSSIKFSYYDLKTGMFPGAHGIPQAYSLANDGDNRNVEFPHQRVMHYKILSNSNFQVGSKNWMELDAGVQYNHRMELSNPDNHGFGPSIFSNKELEFRLFTASVSARFHHEIHERLSLIYGSSAKYQQNDIGGYSYLIPRYAEWNGGLFAYGKWSKDAITLSAGVRYDMSSMKSEKKRTPFYLSGDQISGYLYSPAINRLFHNASASLGFSWQKNQEKNVKVNLGSGFRMPTIPELTANGIHHGSFRHEMGDSTLRPERSLQLDVNYALQKEKWDFSISPFFSYYFDYIFLDPTSQFSPLPEGGLIYQYNQADGLHTGLEFLVDYHFISNLHLSTQAQWVYTYNLESGYNFPFIPPATGNVILEYAPPTGSKKWKVDLGIKMRWAAPQFFVARNELTTPGYALLDLYVMTEFQNKNHRIQFMMQGNNLSNQTYFNHVNRWRIIGLPEPGIHFSVGLHYFLQGKI